MMRLKSFSFVSLICILFKLIIYLLCSQVPFKKKKALLAAVKVQLFFGINERSIISRIFSPTLFHTSFPSPFLEKGREEVFFSFLYFTLLCCIPAIFKRYSELLVQLSRHNVYFNPAQLYFPHLKRPFYQLLSICIFFYFD